MNIRKPLFWHQGQFLQPQHFQYVDAYHAAAAGALQRRISPHHWGVVDLDVNVDRLQSGVFELNGGTILFQDGTLAAFPENATVSPRDFRAGWRDQRRPLKVYLGLRRLAPNDPNVTVVTDHDAAGRAGTALRLAGRGRGRARSLPGRFGARPAEDADVGAAGVLGRRTGRSGSVRSGPGGADGSRRRPGAPRSQLCAADPDGGRGAGAHADAQGHPRRGHRPLPPAGGIQGRR